MHRKAGRSPALRPPRNGRSTPFRLRRPELRLTHVRLGRVPSGAPGCPIFCRCFRPEPGAPRPPAPRKAKSLLHAYADGNIFQLGGPDRPTRPQRRLPQPPMPWPDPGLRGRPGQTRPSPLPAARSTGGARFPASSRKPGAHAVVTAGFPPPRRCRCDLRLGFGDARPPG